jgi:hypothetical protein
MQGLFENSQPSRVDTYNGMNLHGSEEQLEVFTVRDTDKAWRYVIRREFHIVSALPDSICGVCAGHAYWILKRILNGWLEIRNSFKTRLQVGSTTTFVVRIRSFALFDIRGTIYSTN